MSEKGFAALAVILVVAILLIVGGVWYYGIHQPVLSQLPSNSVGATAVDQPTTNTPVVAQILPTTIPQSTSTLQSATTSQVEYDAEYELFNLAVLADAESDTTASIRYVDGGTITSGPYANYHRLIAVTIGYWQPEVFTVFATKNYKTYIVDDDSSNYSEDVQLGRYNFAKVVGFGKVPLANTPNAISIGNFVLESSGNLYDGDSPATSSALLGLVPGISLYSDLYGSQNMAFATSTTNDPYLAYGSDVLVKDSLSPLTSYYLTSKESFLNSTNTENGILYTGSEISSTLPHYQSYGQFSPVACDDGITPVLKNISINNLMEIGTTQYGTILYVPKDVNSPLDQDEYNSKKDGYDPETGGTSLGSYADYVSKNPVLIFQDFWGRWIALGEMDYSGEVCAS